MAGIVSHGHGLRKLAASRVRGRGWKRALQRKKKQAIDFVRTSERGIGK